MSLYRHFYSKSSQSKIAILYYFQGQYRSLPSLTASTLLKVHFTPIIPNPCCVRTNPPPKLHFNRERCTWGNFYCASCELCAVSTGEVASCCGISCRQQSTCTSTSSDFFSSKDERYSRDHAEEVDAAVLGNVLMLLNTHTHTHTCVSTGTKREVWLK